MVDGEAIDIVGLGAAGGRAASAADVVVNLEAAIESIKKTIEEAELMARIEIDSVHLALSGPHLKGFNSRGVIAPSRARTARSRARTSARAIDAAKAVSLADRPRNPARPAAGLRRRRTGRDRRAGRHGKPARRLEVNVHIITGSQSSTQNMVACVNRAGVHVAETVVEHLAASESVLTDDEKELGVALVDIGGGTTDIA